MPRKNFTNGADVAAALTEATEGDWKDVLAQAERDLGYQGPPADSIMPGMNNRLLTAGQPTISFQIGAGTGRPEAVTLL